MTDDVGVAREKLTEASADWLAAEVPNPFPAADILDSQARSFIEIRIAGGLDAVSGQLQAAVTSGLKMTATGIGLNPAETTISAGICSNLVLAPITGPLGKAATFFEAAGVVIGLATGAHPLALACIKLLAHDEFPHVLSQGLDALIDGSHADALQSDQHSPTMQRMHQAIEQQLAQSQRVGRAGTHAPVSDHFVVLERSSVPCKAQDMPREITPGEPLWLCLGFVPKPSPSADAAHAATAQSAAKGDATKPVVLPLGDDAFFRTLPGVLRRGKVTEVDVPTTRTFSRLSRGEHVILKIGGVGFGTSSGSHSSQAAYQHPGCRTGNCALPGSRCLCLCSVCLPEAGVARLRALIKGKRRPLSFLQRFPRQPLGAQVFGGALDLWVPITLSRPLTWSLSVG